MTRTSSTDGAERVEITCADGVRLLGHFVRSRSDAPAGLPVLLMSRDEFEGVEFPVLLLSSLYGVGLMLSADSFLTMFLGLEIMSLPVYVLVLLAFNHPPAALNSLIVWCGYVLAILLTGIAIAQFSSLQHEILHGHPFRSRLLNETLAFWLSIIAPTRSSLCPLSTAAISSPERCCCASTARTALSKAAAKPGSPGCTAKACAGLIGVASLRLLSCSMRPSRSCCTWLIEFILCFS